MTTILTAAFVAVSLASCERLETEGSTNTQDEDTSLAHYYTMVVGWQDRDIKRISEMSSLDGEQQRRALLTEFCNKRREWIVMRDDHLDGRPAMMSTDAARIHLEVNEICQNNAAA